jgi:hypothetical protein
LVLAELVKAGLLPPLVELPLPVVPLGTKTHPEPGPNPEALPLERALPPLVELLLEWGYTPELHTGSGRRDCLRILALTCLFPFPSL